MKGNSKLEKNSQAKMAKLLSFMILALLFTLLAIPVYGQIPALPDAFFGNVTINGNPAPIGTEVKALGEGVKVGIQYNPFITTEVGKYGSPYPLEPKLVVQGNIATGAPIRFYVNGVDTGQTYPFAGDGMTKRLDLSVTIAQATIVQATIAYSPSSLTFTATEGANPSNQTLSVANAGGGTLNWSVSGDAAWLSVSPASGSSTGEVDGVVVSVNAAGLKAGSYSASITVSGGANITPQTVSVNLTISPPPQKPGLTSLAGKITSQGITTQSVTAQSDDKVCKLTIDSGTKALDKPGNPLSQIVVNPVSSPPALPKDANIIGLAYDLGPDGASFSPRISLDYSYDPSKIPAGVNEKDLVIAYYDKDTSAWVELESTVNTTQKILSAKVSHFTAFAILGYKAAAPLVPATFSLSPLTISPTEVNIGETVTIGVLVANTGGQEANYKVVLKIGGKVETIKEITVAAGGSKQVTFSIRKDVAGTYSIDVNGLIGSFKVREAVAPSAPPSPAPSAPAPSAPPAPPSPPSAQPPINWNILGLIIAGVVVMLLLILLLARRRTYY